MQSDYERVRSGTVPAFWLNGGVLSVPRAAYPYTGMRRALPCFTDGFGFGVATAALCSPAGPHPHRFKRATVPN